MKNRLATRNVLLAIVAASLALPAAGARAQEIGETTAIRIEPALARDNVAGNRVEPGFSPQPVLAGPFILTPSLSLAGGYDSNVVNRPGGEGDAVATFTPRLGIRANTPRHLLELVALGHFRRFASETNENSEEFDLAARGELDLAPGNALFARARYSEQIEPRSSVGVVPDAAEPVSFGLMRGDLGAEFEFGSLWVRPAVHYEEREFSDLALTGGGSADLSFRDLREYGGDLALGYRVSGPVALFSRVAYSESESTDPAPGAARDAEDLAVLAGIRGELGALVEAEFAVGYRQRDFALARFQDFEGFTYRGDLQWFVTPLLTLRAQASQDFLNSGLAQVAGILSNRFSLTAYYDPLRNLRVSAAATYEHNEYRETDTSASRPGLRLAAQYRLGPQLSLGAFAGVQRQGVTGSVLVPEFTSLSAGLGLTFTP